MTPDDFDSILDSCLADMVAGRAALDTCLRRYPAHAEQLVVLLPMAEQTRSFLPPAHLPDDKRRVLETRLLRQASQIRSRPVSRPVAARPLLWRRGLAWSGAAVIAVFLLVTSAVGASAASVPGDFLYPVKRTTEQLRLTLASQEGQVDLHLEFARQRSQELQVVEDRGEVPEELLSEISAETAQVLDKIAALPRERQHEELVSLMAFQDQHLKTLKAMAASAQGDKQVAVMAALADITAKHQQALNLLAGADSSSPATEATGQPQPTVVIEETPPAQASSTTSPGLTDATKSPVKASTTAIPGAGRHNPTPDPARMSPGQIKQATPRVPPGQANQATQHSTLPKSTKTPKK